MAIETLISSFDLQAQWCDEMGSPFTAKLMRAAAQDLREGGPVAALIDDWPGNPLADALMMRFAGALHAASLLKRDERLAFLYPDNNSASDFEELWPVALAWLKRDAVWVREFLTSPPQTNETRRSIAMLPGFLALAKHGPLHLLEIGSSAGLLQNWDRFRYETRSWSWGPEDGPLMDTEWRGLPPDNLEVRPIIASRAACDQNPLDVRNDHDVLRLKAYVWADQPDRTKRLLSAIELARAENTRPERADALDWIGGKLKGQLAEGVTVIFHSMVWLYIPAEKRAAITALIEAAGKRADKDHRLAWLRFEPLPVFGLAGQIDHVAVHTRLWPGEAGPEETRVHARANGHASWVEREN
jgi:hypothetical protein